MFILNIRLGESLIARRFLMAAIPSSAKDFISFIDNRGIGAENFCVGATENPSNQLHYGHNVNLSNLDSYILKECSTPQEAQEVENFLENLGCERSNGRESRNSTHVYLFLKNALTRVE
jgi:hypothetical protein